MGFDEEEGGPYGHPLGGYDLRKMAEQLEAVIDLTSAMAAEIQTLKAQIADLSLISASNVVEFRPRNWRSK